MAKRTVVVDVAEEGQQLQLQPTNTGALPFTTGPEVVPIAPLGGTYWVDNTYTGGSSDGSDERPFTTIGAGVARIALQALRVGTLLIAGNPDYTAEGAVAVANGTTVGIFAWRAPAHQPVTFTMVATGAPVIYLRGCSVTLTLGNAVVQTDMTSIVAISSSGASSLVMRGGSARLAGQICRLSGEWDDAACSLMHVGTVEAALDCVSLSTDACAIEGTSLVAGTLTCRTTSFSTAITLTVSTITMDRQSERSAALAGARPSTLPVPLEPRDPLYGTGGLGNVTQAAGTLSLADNAEGFANLTISGTGTVEPNRHFLRVQNLLDLSAAPASAITVRANRSAGDAAGAVGGTGGVGENGWIQGSLGLATGSAGATATSGAGTTPVANTNARYAYGGASGAVGVAGTGAGGAGGAAAAANVTSNARVLVEEPRIPFVGPCANLASAVAELLAVGSQPGRAGGAGGGGGGAVTGGGGGGGAAGAGCLVIYARGIKIGAATPAGCIFVRGYNGGDGGVGQADALAAGGGSGGGGSGGGLIFIVYDWIIGSGASASMLSAPGGDGGPGGNGNGSGAATGGSGGGGGDGGQIITQNLLTGVRARTTGTAGAGPTAAAGNVGGGVAAGGTCTASL